MKLLGLISSNDDQYIGNSLNLSSRSYVSRRVWWLRVKSVDFLLTFECPAECKHCSYKAGPNREGYMRLTDAERYLKELTDIQPLQCLTVHGGEPFLYFEHLKRIIEKAKELEIPRRWVLTNGYWAETKEIAKEKLNELKEAGLTCITFSVDGFHQEYIPLKTVRNGIEAAIDVGFERITVDSYSLGQLNLDNFYNSVTRKAIESLKELDNKVEFNVYPLDFEGRAAELAEYVEPKAEPPKGECKLPSWISGDLENPEGIEIDFEGNVTLCPGICIGNTRVQSLTEIIQNYNCHAHPILSIINKEGPIGLLKDAISKGFKKHQKFINECHLCYEMRKFLMRYYPQHLAPANCY